MPRTFSGTVSPCRLFWYCQLSIAEYKTWSTSCFNWQIFCFSACSWCQGRVRKKTADEIPAEGNCQQFLQGASVWAAWAAPFTQFISPQWKLRRANSGLFRIHPHVPPPSGGLSELIFVADKLILKISYSIYFDYFSIFSSISRPTMETKKCQFGPISYSATRFTSFRRFFIIYPLCGELPNL